MPDYIYLLEHRLSADQRSALRLLRDAAREAEMILFLTGDAVRDLTSGHAVRDLEVAVHGNALSLKPIVEKIGGKIWGEDEASRSLYLCFPGTVRVDVVSTHRTEYPKPGEPVYHPASIQEDLRRRDFTVNAMALSLNEGSYGLLMDPLNGAADIEARTLRLVSNYGFLEEPSLLIRATRYRTRLGWEHDPKTQTRYENAKEEGVIELLSAQARSQELEQIGHEEDGLKILHALEAEGWMRVLFPAWTPAKADEEKLKALHELAVELLVQGVHADISAAQMQLLTAKLAAKDLAALKKLMLRPGFVEEWNSLDALAAGFAKVLLAKENQTPSSAFKLFTSYDPEAVLWLGFTSKDKAVLEQFNRFLKVWPETRQHIPHALMQEMRIKPELANYNKILQLVFLELIDGRLTTPEEMRAFLEPYSPPAPPPQVTIKRTRAKRGSEPKVKDSFDDEDEEDSEDSLETADDLDDMGGDEDEMAPPMRIPKVDLESDDSEEPEGDSVDSDDDDSDEEPEPPPAKRASKSAAPVKPAKLPPPAPAKANKPASGPQEAVPHAKLPVAPKTEKSTKGEPALHSENKTAGKHTPLHTAKNDSGHSKPAVEIKHVGTARPDLKTGKHGVVPTPAKSVTKAPVKPAVKAPAKSVPKAPAKPAAAKAKSSHAVSSKAAKAPKSKKPLKVAPKKPVHKPAKKH
jgi:tRNA nucleotidyltransferase (CCA-adding enzyme)